MKRNIEFNGGAAAAKVTPSVGDARLVCLQNAGLFEVVDLDPYGSPSKLLDSAVQASRGRAGLAAAQLSWAGRVLRRRGAGGHGQLLAGRPPLPPATGCLLRLQAVSEGGLLLVTATDMAVLCGNNGEACYAKYASYPLHK